MDACVYVQVLEKMVRRYVNVYIPTYINVYIMCMCICRGAKSPALAGDLPFLTLYWDKLPISRLGLNFSLLT